METHLVTQRKFGKSQNVQLSLLHQFGTEPTRSGEATLINIAANMIRTVKIGFQSDTPSPFSVPGFMKVKSLARDDIVRVREPSKDAPCMHMQRDHSLLSSTLPSLRRRPLPQIKTV